MKNLWKSDDRDEWRDAFERYEQVVGAQGVAALPALDSWYRGELPSLIAARRRPHVTHPELVRVTEWKMARGVWRGRNLALVRGNDPALVVATSAEALGAIPDESSPISTLAELAGVGPATASAVAAAVRPDLYPFFDELVGAQVPGLGKLAFSLGYYKRYAAALRARAAELGDRWTAVMVERALWAHAGGKSRATGRPGDRTARP
jgi:hypothetical protein